MRERLCVCGHDQLNHEYCNNEWGACEKCKCRCEQYEEESVNIVLMDAIYCLIEKLENEEPYVSRDMVIQEVDNTIKELKKLGEIYSPKHNQFKITQTKGRN